MPVKPAPNATVPASTFDVNSLPTVAAKLGAFPYIGLPEGYTYNGTKTLDYDRFLFAIDGKIVPLEGRLFRASITKNGDVSKVFIEKSFVKFMESIGAKKLNDSTIDFKLYELAKYENQNADVNIGQVTNTYGIKTPEGRPVIFQLGLNSPTYNIMQVEDFKQTIALLPAEAQADNLQKAIENYGKAILHIHFDTDKAILQAEGTLMVDEIVKLLKTDSALKLSVEGHTDNAGSPQHNLTLSEARAVAVRDKLIAAGIDPSRIKSAGFGDTKPLIANDNDVNKARNRRVELVKF